MVDFNQQHRISPEVYHSTNAKIHLANKDIEKLKNQALLNSRKRIRFCSHETSKELV